MSGALTMVQQHTELGEGLAVGCLVVGVSATTTEREPLAAAFAGAVQGWSWASRYPSVLREPDLAGILGSSERRRFSRIARWITSRGVFVPQLRDPEWDLTAACVQIEERTTVPARHWTTLAEGIVDRLDDALVWRAPPAGVVEGELSAFDL
ncbi:hypothetical protein LQ327_31400 [Actinomycetospora endophytica]|uniref:Uncharacterized protein n=1 Tax=Actinomycetospora endophytica TaxID=2291215 RepID=A0ABS8PK58_9PSEU|nr:hypothetical protein [Actinomycetospora endophytica]MCD2197885.1 hypothetical protein [Actinomycetospora endophytica]